MQHRFTMPPLEVEEFPQAGISQLKMLQTGGSKNDTDILQEFLSVAEASQELINQSNYSQTWVGNENHVPQDDFTFMVGSSHMNEIGSMGYNERTWEDPNMKLIEIGDLEDEFKAESMAENLRWFGMSSKDFEKVNSCLFLVWYLFIILHIVRFMRVLYENFNDKSDNIM